MKKELIILRNSFSLYIMTFVRMVFPLITLPYLTRVLSYEAYGTVNYINSVMTYIHLIIDFGFLLSATAEISKNRDDAKKVSDIISNVIFAKVILAILSFIILIILCCFIPLLQKELMFVFLSFLSNIISIFLLDFFFQGIEEMHILTIRFILTQTISTTLTFLFVRGDQTLIYIPILNLISTGIAAIFSVNEILLKYKIKLVRPSFKEAITRIRISFIYWISDISSTIFTALNTLLIGIYMSATDVALWSISLQIILTIQKLYTPITNSLYPYMIREPCFKLIKKVLIIFLPIVSIGCLLLWILSGWILTILGGEKYIAAIYILRSLVPLTFLSFPALLFGWPVLGAISKVKETSISTIMAAITQIICLLCLIITGNFRIINIAYARTISESILLVTRLFFTFKNRHLFIDNKSKSKIL